LGLDQLEPISQVFKILDATLELMNDQDAAAPVQLIDDNDKRRVRRRKKRAQENEADTER
ncbi:hypothetical protein, partial [Thiolapillus sp.]